MTKPSTLRGGQQRFSRCCVPTCPNNAYNTNGVSFFRFPKDEERCRKWVAKCGRKDLQNKSVEKLSEHYCVCSAHFRKEDFSTTHRCRLIWNAVPTIFKRYKVPSCSSSGIVKAKQKHRRLFGFATRRKVSTQLRNEPPQHATVSCVKSTGMPHGEIVIPRSRTPVPAVSPPPLPPPDPSPCDIVGGPLSRVEPIPRYEDDNEETDEAPRLPVFIEDHCYAVNSVATAETVKIEIEKQASSSSSSLGLNDMQRHPGLTSELMPAVEALTALGIPTLLVDNRPTEPPPPPPTMAKRPRSKKGPRLMQDFLLPHLDKCTFGDRLKWIDRANGIFQIGWYHKNGAEWKNDDCIVFLEWDKLKKRPVAQSPHYWMEAKQRFRAALGKVSYGWTQPGNVDQKNVKIRKVKWSRDVNDVGGHPSSGSGRTPRTGRVHRPMISRVRKVSSPPPQVKEEEEDEEEEWNPEDKDTPAVCHRCGYMTRNRRVFLRHRMMHRDMRAFCCRYCTQRFCLPESLFLHLQVHSERYPYTCSSCGVRTRLLLQLWRHELRRIAERVCLCHRCGLMCHVRSNLRLHLQRAHGIVPRSRRANSCAVAIKAEPFSDTSSSSSPLPHSKASSTRSRRAQKRQGKSTRQTSKAKRARTTRTDSPSSAAKTGRAARLNAKGSRSKQVRSAKTFKAPPSLPAAVPQSSDYGNMLSALDVLSSTSVTLAEMEAAAKPSSLDTADVKGQFVRSGESVLQVALDDLAQALVSAEQMAVSNAQPPSSTTSTASYSLPPGQLPAKRVRVPKKILSM